MSTQGTVQPILLPINQPLKQYLNSSTFLSNNVWKIAFSPCSKYLAVPKQDIYGQYCVLIIHCSNWQSNCLNDSDLRLHSQLTCTSAIWSLGFGQKQTKLSSTNNVHSVEKNLQIKAHCDLLNQRRSSLSNVNRRYDFTKHLFLAAGLADGKINIWNVNTGELTLILEDHRSTVCGLDFTSCTMQLATCSHDTTIKLWDLLDDGNMYKTLDEWTHVINSVKWSYNETLLCAVGPYGLVVLYDTTTWEELFKLEGHLHTVIDCAFSSDSALLVTASYDTHVFLWSTITGEILKKYLHKIPPPLRIYAGGDNGAFVRSVAITKNDHLIITACDDNKVRWYPLILNRSTNTLFERIETNALCVAATGDGKTLAVSNRNGEVRLLSNISTTQTNQPSPLKHYCRLIINSCCGSKRKNICNIFQSKHLTNYLLYKDINIK